MNSASAIKAGTSYIQTKSASLWFPVFILGKYSPSDLNCKAVEICCSINK